MDCPVCGNEIETGLSICPFCRSAIAGTQQTPRNFSQRTVNLEEGRPTVEVAINRLAEIIQDAARRKINVLTLIHGYGSSGKGGLIRTEVRKMLAYMAETGTIADYLPGESFTRRNGKSKQLLQRFPLLAADKNLGRGNKGITLVVLTH